MSSYTIPNVISHNPRGERIMDVFSHLLTERIIYLGTPIDEGVAGTLIAQLLYLESANPEDLVQLYINSPGGDPSSMLAVYDTIQYIRCPVGTTCIGQAAGVAAILLAAGEYGRRAALSHSRIVLAQPISQGQRGTIPELILHADEMVRVRSDLETALSRHTGQPIERIQADSNLDHVFTAEDACTYGIVDRVLTMR
ncbi:ATP-dependent Clp protease proteolytic subunit [Actinomycetaceae bacterium WB03_NA08]|uniref:ATP-dependent Clp protease proteolytic subunit n=1 Tax=Scrofimicrobium canadense TaxID=2652290 RepID=A0A6N7W6M1_9ACTO|nr:ATP-dependent Clp protease proteolytic subunit [Scrofimicrobium canadense]MSS85031.1 ATP-dependent Clp protease proteolytic subunit [Scrofimicrobium canadense]